MRRGKGQSIRPTYQVRCERTAAGEFFIKIPDALMESLFWQVEDVIEWRKCRSSTKWSAVNLSVQVFYASRFRRNLTSVKKAINNPNHPLQRVGIKCHPSNEVSVVALQKTGASQILNKKNVQGFFDIYVKALGIFGSTKRTNEWLQSSALALDGRSPLAVFSAPQGVELINTLLDRMNYGVYT